MPAFSYLLAASAALQFVAAGLALWLIRLTGRRWAWLLIASAFVLMAVRRCILLVAMGSGGLAPHSYDLLGELVALVSSALLVLGVAAFAPLLGSLRRSEAALRESEERYRSTLDALGDAIHVVDADLRITLANPAFTRWCKELDLAADATGSSVFKVFPFLPHRVRDEYQQVFDTGKVLVTEESADIGGRTVATETRKIPILEAGRVARVATVIRDITQRRLAEATLQNAKQMLQLVMDNIPQHIFWKDRDSVYLGCNTNFARVAGIGDPSEIVGKTDYDMAWKKEEADFFRECDRRVMATNTPECHIIEPQLQADGKQAWLDTTKVPLHDTDGRVIGILGTYEDITERKRAEEALRESQRTLATLMSNLPGMAYRCRNDRDWTMEFVSDGCRDLTGYDPSDLTLNRRISYAELIHPDDRAPVWDDVQAALREERPFQLVYRIIAAGDEEKWVWEQGQGVFRNGGELVALEGFMTDITARKRLEEQLHQANKMEAVGLLAGGVAHDFNNILTAILGNVELIKNRPNDPSRVRGGLDQIEHCAQSAATLTRHLLTFSRRQVVRPELLSLDTILAEMQPLLRRWIGEDIHLEINLAGDLGLVRADAAQIEQVVMNLVVNARDAMPDGGQLTIETRNVTLNETYVALHRDSSPGPHVMLSIRDTGCGMDHKTLQRIFEPFFTTKQPSKGTGLGLSIVFGIVKQAGGSIWTYSEPGEGTTFKIYLPCAPVGELVAAAACSDGPLPRGNETILLAEDEKAVRSMTGQALREWGYTVLEAENGRRALELAGSHPQAIDLLITDVVMPDLNGAKLAASLREVRPRVKVLYFSGYTSDVISDRGVLRDGVEFLEKPFPLEDLARRVRTILDSPAPTGA